MLRSLVRLGPSAKTGLALCRFRAYDAAPPQASSRRVDRQFDPGQTPPTADDEPAVRRLVHRILDPVVCPGWTCGPWPSGWARATNVRVREENAAINGRMNDLVTAAWEVHRRLHQET